jgi:hypothetical protein
VGGIGLGVDVGTALGVEVEVGEKLSPTLENKLHEREIKRNSTIHKRFIFTCCPID